MQHVFDVIRTAGVSLLPMLLPAVIAWAAHRIKTPTDQDRAQHLANIATDAAALVVSLNPRANWTQLLDAVVNALRQIAGLPTDNDVLRRAAAGALTKLGIKTT